MEEADSPPETASPQEVAEREFQIIMDEMAKEEAIKSFLDGFTKLFDMYHEKKTEIEGLKSDIDALERKIGDGNEHFAKLQKQYNLDHSTVEGYKAEAARAKALADQMHARELAAMETIENLRRQNAKMTVELDIRRAAGADDEDEGDNAQDKEKYEKERAKLLLELEALRSRLKNAINYQEELERKNSEADLAIQRMEEEIEDQTNEATRQTRIRTKMQEEISDHKTDLVTRNQEIVSLGDQVTQLTAKNQKLDRGLKESRAKVETLQREAEVATTRHAATQHSLEQANGTIERLNKSLLEKAKELANRNDQLTHVKNEILKNTKSTGLLYKRLSKIEKAKYDCEKDRDRLRSTLGVMEREVMLSKKQNEADKREIENNARDKEIINKAVLKLQAEAQDNLTMLNVQEQRRKKLEFEIEQHCSIVNRQRLSIKSLEKEKDRLLEEEIALNERIDDVTEDVRLRDQEILELQKTIREHVVRFKKQQNAFDMVRSERNLLSKNYLEAQDAIADLKQKLKMLAYQIEQMKEDVVAKERLVKTAENELTRSRKRIEDLKAEVQQGVAALYQARSEIKGLQQEEGRLNKVILDAEADRNRLLKEREGLMNERDIIGTQLVRRNDEIALLYEKIRILQHTLQRGEKQYEQRLEDIRLLRLEIRRLRREKNLLAKGIENMTDLRLEVFNLEREAARERLRVKALEEALETPLNIHRWRKLQGTDPDTMDLLSKVQILQKKILFQSQTIVKKDRKLKETEKLYETIKDMLALQPSPEIQMQLTQTQKALTQRGIKMKCLVSELSMKNSQVTEYKLELQKVNTELKDVKNKYFSTKKAAESRNRALGYSDQEGADLPGSTAIQLPATFTPLTFDMAAALAPTKTLGGGFKLVDPNRQHQEEFDQLPDIQKTGKYQRTKV